MIIGLTGGIGSGKSTVSGYICEKYGFRLVDADQISRELVKKGSPLLEEIARTFGPRFITDKGELRRKALGREVFSREGGKEKLDSIMMPAILDAIRGEAENAGENLLIDAALLFEEGIDGMADTTILVDADEETRVRRVCARDGACPEDVRNRIKNQMPSEDKRKLADHVIDNSGSVSELYENVDNLLRTMI